MSQKTLIRNGTVLTLGTKTPNFPNADLLIEDGNIAEVGPDLRARDAFVVDATDTIIMPGFVDTHRHTWKSLFRNLGADHPGAIEQIQTHLQPDDVYAATLIGLLGAVESGVTTVVDWSDFALDEAWAEAALQAHVDAGVRTVLVPGIAPQTPPEGVRSSFVRLVGQAAAPLTTIAAGLPTPTLSSLDQSASAWTAAREIGLRIHVHAGLDTAEEGSVAELGKRNLLGPDVTLVHCTRLSDADLDAIAISGAAVSLTPSTEMAGSLGSPPIQELLDRKIRLALGVDDELLAPGDIFAQMRATISVQHATYFDLKLAGKAGLPNLLTTRDVIRYGTVDGARAAGLETTVGSLTPGKQADLIVLRTDRPNIFPINDAIGAVVWGMDTSNIDWVFVAGNPVMRDGKLVADTSKARQTAGEAQQRVAAAAGLTIPSLLGTAS